jgi:hypothetical protein
VVMAMREGERWWHRDASLRQEDRDLYHAVFAADCPATSLLTRRGAERHGVKVHGYDNSYPNHLGACRSSTGGLGAASPNC